MRPSSTPERGRAYVGAVARALSNVFLWGPIVIALAGPTYILARARLGNAAAVAFLPALIFAAAGLVTSWTAWGQRDVADAGSTRTAELVHGSVILALAGVAGLVVAGFAHLPDRGVDA